MSRDDEDEGIDAGCGCMMFILAVAAVCAAAMSLAAVVDPFDWFPSFDTLWADCDDDYGTDLDECSYAVRFPGFWWHLVANLGYAAALLLALVLFAGAVTEFRARRAGRLTSAEAFSEYEEALGALCLAGVAMALLSGVPILVGAL